MYFLFLIFTISTNETTHKEFNQEANNNSFIVQLSIFGIIFVICVLSYNFGKQGIQAQVKLVHETLQEFFKSNFGIDVEAPKALGLHEFKFVIPMRKKAIYEIIFNVKFSFRCDPLNLLKSSLSKVKNTITVEFSVFQANKISAMIHFSKDRPFFLNDFRLIDKEVINDYKVFSDVHKEIDDIVNVFKNFVKVNTNIVDFVEMSDMNRFETKGSNRYVSYNQITLDNHINKKQLTDIMDFAFEMTDLFTTKKISDALLNKNRTRREKLIKAAKERMERVKKQQERLLESTKKEEEHEKAK